MNHEILDDSMELAALVANGETGFSVLAGAELPEISGSLGGDVGEELHLDATGGDGANGDVEEHDRILWVRRPHVPLHSSQRHGKSFLSLTSSFLLLALSGLLWEKNYILSWA